MTILGTQMASDAVMRGLTVFAIAAATIVGMRAAGRIVRRSLAAAGSAVPATSVLVNISRAVILVVGLLAILSVFDISITPILTALGVGGLAVSLALQDTLSNLFAGLQIIATKQIRPGDYVLLDSGHSGAVEDVAWRTTTLRTPTDNLVIVPNAVLAQTIVTNFRLPAETVTVLIPFGVNYGSNLERVEKIATEVATQVSREFVPDSPQLQPLIRFSSFDDSQITCTAIMYAPAYGDQFPLKSAFIKTLHERFEAEGIGFPFPTRTVHLISH